MDEHPQEDQLHYPNLTIRGFRAIKDFTAEGLGRVTLITGMNNSGKSSLLEALYLHTHNAAPAIVRHILGVREESDGRLDEYELPDDPDSLFQASALFHGFPRLSDDFEPIVISTEGKDGRMELTMRVDWVTEERGPDGARRLAPGQRALFGGHEPVPVLVARTEKGSRSYGLERFRRRLPGRPIDVRMPCISVGPYTGERTGELDHLWSNVALTDDEGDLVDALRIIDPGISAVSIVVSEAGLGKRTAMVRSADFSRPVPLRSFGDGMARIFAIVLSLINARGGLLLIDEFENGLHHEAQLDVWRMIFRLARRLDVQVFAASHSRDAVEAFQKAAAEVPEEGSLLRLTRRYGNVIPTVFSEDELAIVARDRIEVR